MTAGVCHIQRGPEGAQGYAAGVPYRFLDHTADVAVELRAPTRDELFADALVAFTDTTTDPATVTPREAVRIEVAAEDAESLLVEFLDELVYRFEVDGMLFREAEVTIAEHGEAGDGSLHLTAEARGEPYDPGRHPSRVHVKAITWHGLEVRREPGGSWLGRVIFDI
jgi:SHS2 domain-containing protein